ncbi:MAG: hypothetical protein F4081_06925 [Dehalococcoidia bacterium]|nr:hypothetical protein [Dehalococcoidia bacterium]
MAHPTDATAPAAGMVNILSVIRRYRLRDFPRRFSPDDLHHVGIPFIDVDRTMHALKLLDLLTPNETPTERFQTIQEVESEEDYHAALEQLLRDVYEPIFELVPDPANASDMKMRSAFREYEPPEERERMLALFRALCAEAGMIDQASGLIPPILGTSSRNRQVMQQYQKDQEASSQG